MTNFSNETGILFHFPKRSLTENSIQMLAFKNEGVELPVCHNAHTTYCINFNWIIDIFKPLLHTH